MNRENFEIASKLATEKNFVIENLGLSDFSRIATYHSGKVDLYAKTLDFAEQSDSNDKFKAELISIDEYVREFACRRFETAPENYPTYSHLS